MSTIENTALADEQALMESLTMGKPLDPDAKRRIQERGQKITDEIRRKHGVLDIAVDLIRSARDGQ
jgi:hypothetical protein